MRVGATFLALILSFACTAVTFAASSQTLTLYQGAQVTGRLRSDVNSGNAHVGDQIVLDVVPPYPSGDPAYQGAVIVGEIQSVTPAGQGRNPAIGVKFDSLRMPDGTTTDFPASLTSDERKSDPKSGARIALTTIGGMLVGNAIGKTIFHTGGGGVAGAIGGFLYGNNQKANFDIPAGSNMQLVLNQTVVIRRQPH
ncbi:MAG TPA: hypothetical protein VKU62_05460 [Thermoanaerobaculia bacterium]|nr:hypothetical protein [Thermoanaerobaculia bacterium]